MHLSVLFVSFTVIHSNNEGLISGFTDNYIKISLPFDDSLVNEVRMVEIGDVNPEGYCHGTLVD